MGSDPIFPYKSPLKGEEGSASTVKGWPGAKPNPEKDPAVGDSERLIDPSLKILGEFHQNPSSLLREVVVVQKGDRP